MRHAIAMLIVVLASIPIAHAKPHAQQFNLRAKVLDIVIIPSPPTALPRDYFQADFDARFAVTMRIISISPSFTKFRQHRTVTFAIHSPSLLFATRNPRGKTYDFILRSPEADDSNLWSLHVRRPNQAMQPTADLRAASLCMINTPSFHISLAVISGG